MRKRIRYGKNGFFKMQSIKVKDNFLFINNEKKEIKNIIEIDVNSIHVNFKDGSTICLTIDMKINDILHKNIKDFKIAIGYKTTFQHIINKFRFPLGR